MDMYLKLKSSDNGTAHLFRSLSTLPTYQKLVLVLFSETLMSLFSRLS